MTTDKKSSAGDATTLKPVDHAPLAAGPDAAPLQPTPRVDKIALRHEGQPLGRNDAIAQYNDLLDLARKLETDLASAQLEEANAEQSYVDCKATLADERYCHGQSIVSLKQAASEEIKAANERASSAELALEEANKRWTDKPERHAAQPDMVLVPREPTSSMIECGFKSNTILLSYDTVRTIYRAMLGALPTP